MVNMAQRLNKSRHQTPATKRVEKGACAEGEPHETTSCRAKVARESTASSTADEQDKYERRSWKAIIPNNNIYRLRQ